MVAPRRLRRALAVALVALVALAALACTSPTLPLPPPSPPSITQGSSPETVRLTAVSGAEPHAVIVIINQNSALPRDKRVSGTIADAEGTWEAEVIARSGDVLDISQDNGSVRSPIVSVTVR
jgi:hypothetical protein